MIPSSNKQLLIYLSVWGGVQTHAFAILPSSARGHGSASAVLFRGIFQSRPRSLFSQEISRYHPQGTILLMTTAHADIDFDSTDPFVVLGLDPSQSRTIDKKEIKRAYKRLALRYHPDVTTNKDSSAEEKREASDRFSKINAAYEILSGKRQGATASATSSSSSGGWTPPHRRKYGEYTTNTNGPYYGSGKSGTSWEDFMPKYDDADYDAGGDSFGSILSDLFAGAAGAAAGGGVGAAAGAAGVVKDFIDFLEGNIDGYSSGSGSSRTDDAELTMLLQTGTVDEIAEEMDDTDLVVQQLTTKQKNLQDELIMLQADLAGTTRYMDKLDLEERMAEVEARKGVVENYLKKARKRLLSLQTRYKELIVGGANDRRAGGRSRTNESYRPGSSSRSSAQSSDTYGSTGSSGYASAGSQQSSSTTPEDSWKTEGFGSSGRSRGGSRRRTSRSRQSEDATAGTRGSYQEPPSESRSSASRESTSSASSSGYQRTASPSQPPPTQPYIPPHRRTSAYSAQDDTERLRKLKVDDEFEKLKKDLGL